MAWVEHVVSGISFGMLLFLIASGLTLTFGLMGLLNLAHGALYLLAAYVMLELFDRGLGYWPAAVAAIVVMAALGMLLERLLLHRFVNQVLPQIVVTVGVGLIIGDLLTAR